ncbi:hypothetical protein NEOLEDRAFT_578216 [Neolentinus lepideus HHB14362 ss-1]|uniref:Uncharacterized protein n=1 Tax=Neolentinus lepideus HHB14362 ss-1 TaxID=1314782 RepID=A0A165QXQ9_9AGAM|nr:hypothetical protein NEOLEDRAFT_578216 [Neolentinus lepideus HHB14362 ss-1]
MVSTGFPPYLDHSKPHFQDSPIASCLVYHREQVTCSANHHEVQQTLTKRLLANNGLEIEEYYLCRIRVQLSVCVLVSTLRLTLSARGASMQAGHRDFGHQVSSPYHIKQRKLPSIDSGFFIFPEVRCGYSDSRGRNDLQLLHYGLVWLSACLKIDGETIILEKRGHVKCSRRPSADCHGRKYAGGPFLDLPSTQASRWISSELSRSLVYYDFRDVQIDQHVQCLAVTPLVSRLYILNRADHPCTAIMGKGSASVISSTRTTEGRC